MPGDDLVDDLEIAAQIARRVVPHGTFDREPIHGFPVGDRLRHVGQRNVVIGHARESVL